ncbi:reverse transcriptase-related protein with [Klebsormidium nitens]|uniref:Reverse transcriptase-related protein with n=1 Tax=Klebsormidium nitens TaxID=105231 RepID=A0A1Y1HKS1_KLENI|nr:reverse transcriptase-related protein with [Klebsormidium nitens]|eukprot:GAQ79205.1 reverse transcriptase-related protein with [Klebsormidium nitens]
MLNSPSRFWKQYRKRRRGLGSDHEAGLVSHCKALYEQSGVDWEPPGGATRGLESGGLQRNERGANSRLEAQLSEAEVRAALRSLKNGKSADLQGFTAELLKAGEDELVGGLVGVFNKVFEEGVFPASWNEGVLVAIFKKGYPSDYGNYRTVTVGPVLGKLYAMVLNRRITEWAEKGSVRAQGQAGFRQGFRGTDHMLALRVLTERCGRGRNRHLFACFVDFKKAFDVVPRQKLWARLSEIGLGGKVLRSVQSMYAGVRCRVRGEGWISKETFESNRGVKQGCPLSPLLFGLSTDGLEELMRSSAGDPTLKGVAVPLLSFADDVVLLSTCAEGLQKKLALLERFSEQSGLSVNLQKTQVIVFGGQLGVQRVRNEFLYAGERVEIVSSYRGMAQRGVGDQAERVHRVFLRGLLRVRKSALSKAVLGEFGRFPLVIKRWEQIFKFAKRVESLPCNRLAKLAFEESREMTNIM